MQKEDIKCVIAETDQQSVKKLVELIASYPHYKIEATFTNGKKPVEFLNKNSADVAFINIDIPELNGYDFIKDLKKETELIILSSEEGKAVAGYNYNISNFLLKPVSQAALQKALEKTKSISSAQKTAKQKFPHHRFLFIRAEYKLVKINFDDILYIEGLKDYSKIYTISSSGKAIITLQNLKSFEEKLSSDDFIRIHRSYIVSLSKIDMIHKNSVIIGKNEIPISDGFRGYLHSVISKYT